MRGVWRSGEIDRGDRRALAFGQVASNLIVGLVAASAVVGRAFLDGIAQVFISLRQSRDERAARRRDVYTRKCSNTFTAFPL